MRLKVDKFEETISFEVKSAARGNFCGQMKPISVSKPFANAPELFYCAYVPAWYTLFACSLYCRCLPIR